MSDSFTNLATVLLMIRLLMWALRQELIQKLVVWIDQHMHSSLIEDVINCDICLGFWASLFVILVTGFRIQLHEIELSAVISVLMSTLVLDFISYVWWTGIKAAFGVIYLGG